VVQQSLSITLWWSLVYFAPGGDGLLLVSVNSLVDAITYTLLAMSLGGLSPPLTLLEIKRLQLVGKLFPSLLGILLAIGNLTSATCYPMFKVVLVHSILITASFLASLDVLLAPNKKKVKSH